MAERFSLSIILKAVDQLSAPMKKIAPVVKKLGVEAAALSIPLRTVNAGFAGVKRGLVAMRPMLLAAVHPVRALRWEYAKLGLTMKEVGRKLKDVGRDIRGVGRDLMTRLTLPIVALGTFGLRSAIKFESAFVGVQKTVAGTAQELAAIRSGIINMSKQIPSSAEDLFKIAEMAGQLGIETSSVLEFTRVIADLAETSNLSFEEGASTMARFANIMQMSQGKFRNLASSVVAVGMDSAATEMDIMQLAQRLAGAGHAANIQESKIIGLAAAIASVGIEAEAGGTAFSQVMLRMAKDLASGDAKAKKRAGYMARVAQVSLPEFKVLFKKDSMEAVLKFVEGLGRLKTEGKNVPGILDAMGMEGMRVTDALLRASGAAGLFRETIGVATKGWDENTASAAAAAKRYWSVESQLKILWNTVKAMSATFGDLYLPKLRELVEKLKGWAAWLEKLDPQTKKAIVTAGTFVAVLGPLIVGIGGLVGAIGFLTIAVGALSAISAPIWGLLAVIALLPVAAFLIVKYWKPIVGFFENMWKRIKAIFYDNIVNVLKYFDMFIPKKMLKFLFGIDVRGLEDSIAQIEKLRSDIYAPKMYGPRGAGVKWSIPISEGWDPGVSKSRTDVNIKVSSEKGASAVLQGIRSSGGTKVNVHNQAYVGGSGGVF